jgi:hypothetical protein
MMLRLDDTCHAVTVGHWATVTGMAPGLFNAAAGGMYCTCFGIVTEFPVVADKVS